jgi:hypothetical protein
MIAQFETGEPNYPLVIAVAIHTVNRVILILLSTVIGTVLYTADLTDVMFVVIGILYYIKKLTTC